MLKYHLFKNTKTNSLFFTSLILQKPCFTALHAFFVYFRKIKFKKHKGPEYVLNIFSRSLKKTCHQRKTETNYKVFTFQFLNDKFTVISKKSFVTRHFGKIGVLVNFITRKLESKQLAISVFSGQRFFKRRRGNIFHIFRA